MEVIDFGIVTHVVLGKDVKITKCAVDARRMREVRIKRKVKGRIDPGPLALHVDVLLTVLTVLRRVG